MPLLSGGRLIGRVDPAREGRTLVAKQVSLALAEGRTAHGPGPVGGRRRGWAATPYAIERAGTPQEAAALASALAT